MLNITEDNLIQEKYQEIKSEEFRGLKNFTQNIKPTILKIREKQKLTPSELENIYQFYIEVCFHLTDVK